MLQLLEELQYHFSSSTERNIKSIRARGPNRGGAGSGASAAAAVDGDMAPTLQRANGRVLYEYLLTPHVAHDRVKRLDMLARCMDREGMNALTGLNIATPGATGSFVR